ncbi:MAG: NAD-glutamate dehydrogenase, partial [Betaproteobacteria bacterium]
MSTQAENRKSALLAEIEKLINTNVPAAQRSQATSFAAKYCNEVDAEDFVARDAAEWAALSLSHLAFGNEFQRGAPKMRIFNPGLSENGWESPSTVIEFINDDMPFLVDSIAMEITRQGIAMELVLHPLFAATRDQHGVLTKLDDAKSGVHVESWIHVEIERITDPARIKALGDGLVSVLNDVRATVEDFSAMKDKIGEMLSNMGGAAKAVPLEELDEARAFLTWIADNHFTFLGYREYELAHSKGVDTLKIVAKSGLGILREPKLGGVSKSFSELPPEIRALARQPQLLVLTKANSRATVHRPGYLDYIGVKRFDDKGKVIGERRLIGLYTSSTYHADPRNIPLLRRKISQLMSRAGFPPSSHAGKNLFSILQTFPRDELFQISDDELFDTVMGILRLGERARTRMFVRRDVYARYYSCLIFLPRESYNTDVRVKLQEILKRAFNGTSAEFNVQLSESALARVHMLIRTTHGAVPEIDIKALESEVIFALRKWEDGVFTLLSQTPGLGEDVANQARREFVLPFPAAYREDVSAAQAVADFMVAKKLTDQNPIGLSLYRPAVAGEASADKTLRFRLIKLGDAVPLSASLPMLENMGVKVESERSYVIHRNHLPPLHVHDFGLTHGFAVLNLAGVKAKFETAFAAIWKREVENDGFNRLTLAASLAADEILVLRAYAKYLKQTGFTFSQQYVEQT